MPSKQLAKPEVTQLATASPVTRDNDAAARAYASAAFARNTRKAYGSDWRMFEAWCAAAGRRSLPADPGTLGAYIAHLADGGRKASTIARARIGIGKAHTMAGLPNPNTDPAVKLVWSGIRRTIGTATTQKAPISPKSLGAAFDVLPTTLIGVRDRALLMVGFAGGFRRSELVALDVEDVRFTDEGLTVLVRKSKTDQEGKSRTVGIYRGRKLSTCPVRCVRRWLEFARLTEGPLFRAVSKSGRVGGRLNGDMVAILVKKAAAAAGLDPKAFAGHSLRAGLVTAAAKAKKATHSIMKQTGHRDVQTVAGYIRDATIFDDNATKGLY